MIDSHVSQMAATFTAPAMRRIKKIHFIGIGGVGMCGIAEVLHNLGYIVSGSDIASTPVVRKLQKQGIKISCQHNSALIAKVDVVVVSTAIAADNCELMSAHAQRIPVVPRAQMLAELMRYRYGIAVAGTHGKTTTTSLLASILAAAGFDPTFIIGGKLNSTDSNARLGTGRYLVAEADESDASFLHLQPMVTIITNIDADHLQTYHNDFEQLKKTFVEFVHNLPFYGQVIACIDDPVVRDVLPSLQRQVVTYGLADDADYRAIELQQKGMHSHFTLVHKNSDQRVQVTLNMPGEHNVQNALAAYAVAAEEGVGAEAICAGLETFLGVGRRFQVYGDYQIRAGNVMFIDDYGHHPREIATTVATIRKSWPNRRLVMIVQPHRYSRVHDLFDRFVEVLAQVDLLLLLDIYAAGESRIAGIDSATLGRSIHAATGRSPVLLDKEQILDGALLDMLSDGDVLVTQGAGDVGQLAHELATRVLPL